MKNIIKFLLYVLYSTSVFFFPNNYLVLFLVALNTIFLVINIKHIKQILLSTSHLIPFILLTFVINLFLDTISNSIWIAIKLLLVCNMTFIYSSSTSILEVATTIESLFFPLKIFKVDTTDIKILVCISLSMIPILKKEVEEVTYACKAKNIKINLSNSKYILSKFFLSLITRINQVEEALIEKRYDV